jgi:hypothetical protein
MRNEDVEGRVPLMQKKYRDEEYGCRKENLPCHECRIKLEMRRNEDVGSIMMN